MSNIKKNKILRNSKFSNIGEKAQEYSSKNMVKKTSSVNHKKEIIERVSINKKAISLTFDDGPHPVFTPMILKLLKENNSKATFFVLGKNAEIYPEIIRQINDDGHQIGNHTYSHFDLTKVPTKTIRKEFEKAQKIIFEITGKKPRVFRPPYGYYNDEVIKVSRENGYKTILWSPKQDPWDWNHPGVEKITNKVLSNAKRGDIVLLHDRVEGKSETYEALKIIIPNLKKQGYELVTVSELLKLN